MQEIGKVPVQFVSKTLSQSYAICYHVRKHQHYRQHGQHFGCLLLVSGLEHKVTSGLKRLAASCFMGEF